ncbi:MAG: serine protease, partial [Spirochaetae bacterium HGW-Spirochaetae-6]
KGQVIGINTAIFSQSGGSIGIGFAVPINIAKNVVQQLIQKGKVERGYIGAFVQDIDENLAKYHNLDQIQGVLLTEIESDSPAEKAGLKAGDLVLSANGARVDNASSLITVISNIPPGEAINLEIMRNKKKMNIKVTVGIRGEEKTSQLKPGEDWLGMRFGALNSFRRNFNLPQSIKKGVVITEVKEDTPASQVGLRPGDLVDMINNIAIPDMKSLDSFIRQNKNKAQFLMRVRRAGRIYFVVLNAQ